jgi:hypothetical protein
MSTPTNVQYVMNIMHAMHSDIVKGGKVLIHCHAGLGRTGLIIACYLLYSKFSKSPEEAIDFVREKRPKSIQTRNQVNYVYIYYDYLVNTRIVYPATAQTLGEAMFRQRNYLSGNEYRQLRNLPKSVYVLCTAFRSFIGHHCTNTNAFDIMQGIVKQHQPYVVELPDYKTEDKTLMKQFKKLLNIDQWKVMNKIESRPDLMLQLLFDWLDTLTEPILSDKQINNMSELYEESRETSINASMTSMAAKSDVGKVELQILECLARYFQKFCSLVLSKEGSSLVREFCALIMGKCSRQLLRKEHPLAGLFMQTVLDSTY